MTAAEHASGTKHAPGSPEAEDPYRILIVEDDRSQALFAESVLRGAGLHTRWVAEADAVIAAIVEFSPDLVLMDLHLPGTSGTELTAAIRAESGYAHLPIVFLTGDPDPETEYQALDSGADDFLSKPIRPRHLISAVRNRVQRARLARAPQAGAGDERDPRTGLYRRDRILARLPAAAGALLVEVQHLPALQQRLGYTGTEKAIRAAGARLAELAPDAAARLNDAGFLVLSEDGNEDALAALARRLRDGLSQPIDHDGMPLRLRAAVGYCATGDAPDDPLGALDHALRQARSEPAGLARFRRGAAAATDPGDAAMLRDAMAQDRFELAFQPIAAVAGGDEAQFQVLLRLPVEGGGVLAAGEVIARAEAAGLLAEIDRWVLGRALAVLAAGASKGGPARLFVSQSPQAIAADPQGEWLLQAVSGHGLEPGALVVDLRLDDALVHALALAEFCERLAPHGVRFCLGQYVHGDEAAALLRRLPLGFVRLSPRYSRLDAEPALRDELREIVSEAHAAGLRVIGSQVENPSAAATLWMSGIDYIQGNLIQRVGKELDFDFHHSVL